VVQPDFYRVESIIALSAAGGLNGQFRARAKELAQKAWRQRRQKTASDFDRLKESAQDWVKVADRAWELHRNEFLQK
jgi:hypothetical protein